MTNIDPIRFSPVEPVSAGVFAVSPGFQEEHVAPCSPRENSSVQEFGVLEQSERSLPASDSLPLTLISPQSAGKFANLLEIVAHRDLLQFLVRREVKVRYAQSAIGVGWAVLQPLFPMLVFSVIFGRLAKISSDGIPYALFSFAGLVPWLYFSNGVTDGVNSLIANANMLSKVYFPRLLIPLASVISRFMDFCVAGVVLGGMMVWYGVMPNWGIVVLPWLIAIMIFTTMGVACWLSTMAIQFRDVKHALSFLIQVLMYSAPVVYPTSLIPDSWQVLYALNPMVAVIEGLRSALFGTRDMPWLFLWIGTGSAALIVISGANYFARKQRSFADVA